jgi:hypothetical protein
MSDKKKQLTDSEKLINGGIDLSKKELDELKSRSAEESALILQQRQMKLATMPGYKEFVQIQEKTEILKNMFQNKIEKETLKEATVFKKSNEYKDKFTASNVGNLVSGDKKETAKRTSLIKKIFEAPISKALSRSSFMGGKNVSETMEQFLSLMKRIDDSKITYQNDKEAFERQQEELKESRHKEIMNVFLEATKKNRRASRQFEVKKKEVKKEEKPAAPPPAPPPPAPAPSAPPPAAPPSPTPAPPVKAPPPPAAPPNVPPVTAKPAPSSPPPPPTAVPAPPIAAKPSVVKPAVVGAAKTAAKVGILAAGIAGISKAIGAAESGGNYNITFGDRISKSGKIINSLKSKSDPSQTLKTPQDFFGKPLTDLTLDEVKQFQNYKNSEIPGTGAVGKYQFMPTTLFGRTDKKGNFLPGLVQELNLPMTTRFDEATQDKLFELLHSKDVATLKRLGIPTTPGFQYMAHYLGAGGANAVYKATQKNEDITVAQAMINSGLKVGKNEELYKIKVSEFEKILESRLIKKGGFTPHSSGEATSNRVMDMSIKNNDVKKQMTQGQGATIVINNNQNNNKTVVRPRSETQTDVNPVLGR